MIDSAQPVHSLLAHSWKRRVKEAVLRLAARTVGSRLERALDTSLVRRVLILQLQNVGDSVAFTPTLRALRTLLPSARIDLLCSAVSAQFYRKCRHIDTIFVDRWFGAAQRDLAAQLHLLRSLWRQQYDLAVADASETSASYGAMAFLTRAGARIGFSIDNRGFLYTHPLQPSLHHNFIDDNLAIVRSLGCATARRDVECYFDEEDSTYVRGLLEFHDGNGPLVGIHPVSNWQSKTWFPERWAAVADALIARCGATIMFVGTESERPYIEGIRSLMGRVSFSVAGQTDLPQLGALLSHCALFLGTDSGPRHIAAATQRPQVTLMSSQDYRDRWDFRRDHEVIIRTDPPCGPCFQSFCSHRRCMVDITVETVLSACEKMLAPVRDDDRDWPAAVSTAAAHNASSQCS